MIKSITVTNHLGQSIKLELGHPEKSGFLILNVDGVGPGKATINFTEMSAIDGSLYNSARLPSRNIVLSLKLLPKPTVEDTRQLSYKFFPIKKRIKLLFETHNRTSEIYGYVESNEPVIFTSQENTQISIICPDPYFYSAGINGKKTTVFANIEPSLSFPFSNESLTDDLIEFGDIILNKARTVYYSGDADTGIIIYIHAIGPASNISIYNNLTREIMKIDTIKLESITGSGIIARDDIIISTIKGNKYIKLLREGQYTNILNCLDKTADWFQLANGDNVFTFMAETGLINLQFKIENQTLYEGI
jgi:hypothetical protein